MNDKLKELLTDLKSTCLEGMDGSAAQAFERLARMHAKIETFISAQPAVEATEIELPKPWQCETAICPNLYTAEQMQEYARRILAGVSRQAGSGVPEGWRLVPNEMTQDMYLAFCEKRGEHGETFKSAYKSMLAAAPLPPSPAAKAVQS